MIYAFSMLIVVFSLVVGIPALRKIIYMHSIRKNSGATTGTVESTRSAMNTGGWLMGMVTASEMVNHQRPLVTYQSPKGKAMSLEVVPSNFLSKHKYESNEAVEVAFDLSDPWRAYLVREWAAARRELWISTAGLIAGIALWALGRTYNLPF